MTLLQFIKSIKVDGKFSNEHSKFVAQKKMFATNTGLHVQAVDTRLRNLSVEYHVVDRKLMTFSGVSYNE